MTVADQIKYFDNNINTNQAQYDLDRLAAKISPYSFGDLRKYEYLTGEDLGYQPSVIQRAKFEYFSLGKFFDEGLTEEDKKEGLLRSVKNIGDKNEKLLKAIEDKNEKQLNAIENQERKQFVTKKTETKDNLLYDPNHNFYKYRLSKFPQISSTEPKFDKLEIFYKEFIGLKFLDAKPGKLNHTFTVLNNASTLYNKELILKYKKAYEREPKDDKSYDWKKKFNPKKRFQTINLLNEKQDHCLMKTDQILNNQCN